MRIGAQLYTVRDYCKTEVDLRDTLKKLADFGYEYVQVSGVGLESKVIREACDELNLKITLTHTNPDRLLNDPKAVIEEHKIFGCEYIGIGAMPGKYMGSYEGLKNFIKDYNEVAKVIADNGMSFHYHNHSFEFVKYEGKIGFDIMIEETAKGEWFFIFDTYWAQHGGVNPTEYIEKLDGRIKALHFKDMRMEGSTQKFAAIGSGNLNWDKIIEACKKTNVEYAFIEQDTHFIDDAITELGRSYKFLSSKGLS